jgi:hypothetical protein
MLIYEFISGSVHTAARGEHKPADATALRNLKQHASGSVIDFKRTLAVLLARGVPHYGSQMNDRVNASGRGDNVLNVPAVADGKFKFWMTDQFPDRVITVD